MDLTTITAGFGLLDEETQTALRKHYEKGVGFRMVNNGSSKELNAMKMEQENIILV